MSPGEIISDKNTQTYGCLGLVPLLLWGAPVVSPPVHTLWPGMEAALTTLGITPITKQHAAQPACSGDLWEVAGQPSGLFGDSVFKPLS